MVHRSMSTCVLHPMNGSMDSRVDAHNKQRRRLSKRARVGRSAPPFRAMWGRAGFV